MALATASAEASDRDLRLVLASGWAFAIEASGWSAAARSRDFFPVFSPAGSFPTGFWPAVSAA